MREQPYEKGGLFTFTKSYFHNANIGVEGLFLDFEEREKPNFGLDWKDDQNLPFFAFNTIKNQLKTKYPQNPPTHVSPHSFFTNPITHLKPNNPITHFKPNNPITQSNWIFDCGATDTMTYDSRNLLSVGFTTQTHIQKANGESIHVDQVGPVDISPTLHLINCLLVPSLSHKLLFVHQLTNKHNCTIMLTSRSCIV